MNNHPLSKVNKLALGVVCLMIAWFSFAQAPMPPLPPAIPTTTKSPKDIQSNDKAMAIVVPPAKVYTNAMLLWDYPLTKSPVVFTVERNTNCVPIPFCVMQEGKPFNPRCDWLIDPQGWKAISETTNKFFKVPTNLDMAVFRVGARWASK